MSKDNRSLFLDLEGKHYEIEFDPQDSYVVDDLKVAFCDQLGEDFAPMLFVPKDVTANTVSVPPSRAGPPESPNAVLPLP